MSKFKEFGKQLVLDAQKALETRGNNASGTLSASIEDTGANNEINIVALRYGQSLQFGRQPTVNDGNGELLERIRAWIQAKGLSLSPYAVTKKIHKQGTRRYQQIQAGQNPNADAWISNFATDENIDKALSFAADDFEGIYRTTIQSILKK
jgi:hypothetical protein